MAKFSAVLGLRQSLEWNLECRKFDVEATLRERTHSTDKTLFLLQAVRVRGGLGDDANSHVVT